MAKDGTLRGGRRAGAGRPRTSLVDSVAAGKAAYVMDIPELDIAELDVPLMGDDIPHLEAADLPKPSAWLSAQQRDGTPLGADVIFTEIYKWLKERGCDKLVNPRLVEAYAEAFARDVQCSEAISENGLLGRHPTTDAPVASPFVTMSLNYRKQANTLWYEIWEIVKNNSMTAYEGSPQEDAMEALLRKRGS